MTTSPRMTRSMEMWKIVLFFTAATFILPEGRCNSPPVVVVTPRRWQVPVDDAPGTRVASIRAMDHDNDTLSFSVETSRSNALFGAKELDVDAASFFRVQNIGNGAAVVKINRPVQGIFQPGDQLGLSLIVDDGNIKSRSEVHVVFEQPHGQHDLQESSISTSTIASDNNNNNKDNKESKNNKEKSMDRKKSSSRRPMIAEPTVMSELPQEAQNQNSNTFVLTLVPILFICPALGLGYWALHSQLRSLVRKFVSRSRSVDEEKMESIGSKEGNKMDMDGSYLAETSLTNVTTMTTLPKNASLNKLDSGVFGCSASELRSNSNAICSFEFPRHQLRFERASLLGEGCFGQVWKCEAENIDDQAVRTVAVKTLKPSATEKERCDLMHELAIMKVLGKHAHVVTLLGCCTLKDPIYIIEELVDGPSLQILLRNSRSSHNYRNLHGDSGSLSARTLTTFAHHVARGMAFISSMNVVHRDLAARNILVDSHQICRVADFGFARLISDSEDAYERKSQGKLPIRWMAPESLIDNTYNVKSDVWAFGVLMWEIVTLGATPYPGKAASDVVQHVAHGGHPDEPAHCDRQLRNLMTQCWKFDCNQRPNFETLDEILAEMLVADADYIDLELFPEHAYYNQSSRADERV